MTQHKISALNLKHFISTEGKRLNGAAFTIRSKRTGKDFTFKVSQIPFKGVNYLHIKTETEYLNFRYTGWYRDGEVVRKDKNTGKTNPVTTPASSAVAWFLRQLFAGNYAGLDSGLDIFHLGKCLKCGKTLTDSQSIEIGIGPVCRS